MNRKLFWTAFWFTLILMILLSGCTTVEKVTRYVENHPEFLEAYISIDTLVLTESDTIYRDTTIIVHTPPDTVWRVTEVELPKEVISDTARAELKFAKAAAWIYAGSLKLVLMQKENRLEIQLDSIKVEYRNLEKRFSEKILRPPSEKYRPWWAIPSLIIAIFASLLLILTLLFRP